MPGVPNTETQAQAQTQTQAARGTQAAERYAEAMTVEEYIAQMHQNRERFVANIEQTEISEHDRAVFGREPLHILVITEDWCGDSAQFVPVIARLAQEVPSVELRVLRRDLNLELAAGYPRQDGYQAIPVLILLDAKMHEIGALIERPARVTEEMAAETRRFQREHPELPQINRNVDRMPPETRAAVKANIAEWRAGQQDRFARYLLDDLAEIVEAARR